MRHLGQIGINVFAADIFTQNDIQSIFAVNKVTVFQQIAQPDYFAFGIRNFNTDGIGTGNNGYTDGNGRHGTGNIVGKAYYPRGFCPRCRFQFKQRNDRTGTDFDDFTVNAKLFQNAFQRTSSFVQFLFANA